MNTIYETAINVIGEKTRIEGHAVFSDVTRFHGTVKGDVEASDGSTLILGETALIEGNLRGDTLFIDGCVRGNIYAKTKVVVSCTGRVIGDIRAQNVKFEFGSFFEGRCKTTEGP